MRADMSPESESVPHAAPGTQLDDVLDEISHRIDAGEPVDAEACAREHP
jgi:hypothetical protein